MGLPTRFSLLVTRYSTAFLHGSGSILGGSGVGLSVGGLFSVLLWYPPLPLVCLLGCFLCGGGSVGLLMCFWC